MEYKIHYYNSTGLLTSSWYYLFHNIKPPCGHPRLVTSHSEFMSIAAWSTKTLLPHLAISFVNFLFYLHRYCYPVLGGVVLRGQDEDETVVLKFRKEPGSCWLFFSVFKKNGWFRSSAAPRRSGTVRGRGGAFFDKCFGMLSDPVVNSVFDLSRLMLNDERIYELGWLVGWPTIAYLVYIRYHVHTILKAKSLTTVNVRDDSGMYEEYVRTCTWTFKIFMESLVGGGLRDRRRKENESHMFTLTNYLPMKYHPFPRLRSS